MHIVNIKKINKKNKRVLSNVKREFLSIYNAQSFINNVLFDYEFSKTIDIKTSIKQVKG